MKIKILGCSGGIGPGRRTTSFLMDGHILLDAGTGVGDLLFSRMEQITDVLLTHAHLDHVCGLALLADVLLDRVEHSVRVHSTADTLGTLQQHLFNWRLWPDFSQLPDPAAPRIRYAALAPGEARHLGRVEVSAFEVFHTVPAVGYVVHAGGPVLAFTGDTYAHDCIWDALNKLPRLDYLAIEVSFVERENELGRLSRHFTPMLLARELGKLRHRPRLLLSHHKPGSERAIAAECREALRGWSVHHLRRGDTIEL